MRQFLDALATTIRRHSLLRDRQPLLVAVSGGLDSMVLLHALSELADKHAWRLTVAHFNHQLRGRASEADERLVRQTARRLNLPCVVGHGNVRKLARKEGISIEMAARRLRHDFLALTARARRIGTIALAHHADDQVELFFLRLLRGAGAAGLAGMRWRGSSPADGRITLVRPLLDQHKAALLEFARENKVHYREDASNAALDILRNRIRHRLLPLLRTHFQPELPKIALRQMEILKAESDFLDETAETWLRRRPRSLLRNLPVALQRRIVRRQLADLGVEPDFDLVERLRTSPGRPFMIRPQWTVACDARGRVETRAVGRGSFDRGELGIDLARRGGGVEFGGARLRWTVDPRRGASLPRRVPGCECFDADKVGSTIVLRHWRPGDRFQPIGMARDVKLQDLFVNLKIPRAQRHRLIVAATATGEIWWVEGLRIAEPFKLAPHTRRRLRWQWRRSAVASSARTKASENSRPRRPRSDSP